MNQEKTLRVAGRIVDAWLPTFIQYKHIPGISVAITHKGKIVYKNGFGFSDLEAQKKMTTDTAFRVASISKTFTAIGIMQLVERGKLRLDDPVYKHLPWFKNTTKNEDAKSITIRHLLAHAAGVWRDGDTMHWESDDFPASDVIKKSVSTRSFPQENMTDFKYSNFGYAVLGQVIEKVTGTTYERYMQRSIISKLGMKRTAADYTKKSEEWLSNGYGREIPGEEREVVSHCATNAYAPATGFLSTVEDLAKLIDALSLTRDKKNALLSRQSKKEMTHAYWDTKENDHYGLGLIVQKVRGRKIVTHSGGFNGFITFFGLDTENDIGVVLLGNTTQCNSVQLGTGVFDAIYELMDEGVYSDGPSVKQASKYEGLYRARWGDCVVVHAGSALLAFNPTLHAPTSYATRLEPKRGNTFIMDDPSQYYAPGEEARFLFRSGTKKAHTLLSGSLPMKRVK